MQRISCDVVPTIDVDSSRITLSAANRSISRLNPRTCVTAEKDSEAALISPCAFCRLIGCRGGSYNKRMHSSSTTCPTQTRILAKCRNSVQPASRTASSIDESPGQQRRRVSRATAEGRPFTTLLPIMAVVLIAFLVIGLALPVLPL